jgi:hypothetical protein
MYKYVIYFDPEPINPAKEDDGWITTIVCFHRRYDFSTTDEFKGDRERFQEFMEEHPEITFYPLYMYDHSGITISLSPFGCRWDSGQVGWVYADPDRVKENFDIIGKDKLREIIESEIEVYDKYLQGDIYCFKIITEEGDCVDSCCGFYDRAEAEEQAKSSLEWHEKEYSKCKDNLLADTVNKLSANLYPKEIREILLNYEKELEKLA